LTLVLNVIVLVSFRSPPPNSTVPSLPEFSSDIDYQILLYIIGGVHLFFSVWMVLEYFMLTAPHFVLPEFLYRIDLVPDSFSQYRLTAWIKRYYYVEIDNQFIPTELEVVLSMKVAASLR